MSTDTAIAPAAASTSYEVRAALEGLLERDLLGPRDGEREELPPGTPPAERYLVGRLVPRTRPSEPPANAAAEDSDDPNLVDREVTAAGEVQGDDLETGKVIRTGTMSASALGMSFRVPLGVERLTVTASWGRYAPAKSEVHVTDQGKARTVWRRSPGGGTVELSLLSGDGNPLVIDPEQERVVLRTTVRVRDGVRVVDLALVNDQGTTDNNPDLHRIYQTSITVTALDGSAAVFLGHNDPEHSERPAAHDSERLHLALLYRNHREYAHGRQCAVDAEVRYGELRAWQLRTTSFPSADVPLTVAGSMSSMPGLILDMAWLGSPELARDDLVRALRPLASGYRNWLGDQRLRLADPEVALYEPAGTHALEQALDLADRLDRAIDLLGRDATAREAFRFANQAMALQRVAARSPANG